MKSSFCSYSLAIDALSMGAPLDEVSAKVANKNDLPCFSVEDEDRFPKSYFGRIFLVPTLEQLSNWFLREYGILCYASLGPTYIRPDEEHDTFVGHMFWPICIAPSVKGFNPSVEKPDLNSFCNCASDKIWYHTNYEAMTTALQCAIDYLRMIQPEKCVLLPL